MCLKWLRCFSICWFQVHVIAFLLLLLLLLFLILASLASSSELWAVFFIFFAIYHMNSNRYLRKMHQSQAVLRYGHIQDETARITILRDCTLHTPHTHTVWCQCTLCRKATLGTCGKMDNIQMVGLFLSFFCHFISREEKCSSFAVPRSVLLFFSFSLSPFHFFFIYISELSTSKSRPLY